MRRTENRPSPAPSRADDSPMPYDAASERWARGLSEMTLRSLTSDYLMTAEQNRTDDMIDAYHEFQRREALGLLRDDRSLEMTQRTAKSRKGNRSRK